MLLIAAWQYGKNNSEITGTDNSSVIQKDAENENAGESANSGKSSNPAKIQPGESAAAIWEGTLTASDNISKGNYKLQTSAHTIYIKTSRDFSSLLGKEVKVTYQGTIDSFNLGDIVAK